MASVRDRFVNQSLHRPFQLEGVRQLLLHSDDEKVGLVSGATTGSSAAVAWSTSARPVMNPGQPRNEERVIMRQKHIQRAAKATCFERANDLDACRVTSL